MLGSKDVGVRPAFTTHINTAVPLTIRYLCELTSYLTKSTDFSRWTVCCKSGPGGACSEEKFKYVSYLYLLL